MKGLAFCGLNCLECPAYLATLSGYSYSKEQIAREWSGIYGKDIRPEDINCCGCRAKTGVHFSHCYECSIRLCAMEKGVDNCALCSDYPCVDIQEFMELVPEAGENLRRLRDEDRGPGSGF